MPVITNMEQLIHNLVLIDWYFYYGSANQRSRMAGHIARGHNFIVYISAGEPRFAPSKFVGYINNTLDIHQVEIAEGLRDGALTDNAIDRILERQHAPNPEYELTYRLYCEILGHPADGHQKKFWLPPLGEDRVINHNQINGPADAGERRGYTEGNWAERMHKIRERNPQVIADAKNAFREAHGGQLFCQICHHDFENEYGQAYNIIEGHHTKPISQMQPGDVTEVDDIVMLCPNCHRMVHRYNRWITHEEFDHFPIEAFRNP